MNSLEDVKPHGNEASWSAAAANLGEDAHAAIQQLLDLVELDVLASDAHGLEEIEATIVNRTDQIAGKIIALHVQRAVDDSRTSGRDKEIASSHPKLRLPDLYRGF